MNNANFWASIRTIITEGYTPEGLLKLDSYAEQFISGKLVYQRFSPQEQHGCAAGGTTNVIASLLAGAEAGSDSQNQGALSDYQRECQLGTQQEKVIEKWAKAVGLWTESVEDSLPLSLGEQIYLSDMHDENVIRSNRSDTLFVVDCDIRINTPELRTGGTRSLTTSVVFEK